MYLVSTSNNSFCAGFVMVTMGGPLAGGSTTLIVTLSVSCAPCESVPDRVMLYSPRLVNLAGTVQPVPNVTGMLLPLALDVQESLSHGSVSPTSSGSYDSPSNV